MMMMTGCFSWMSRGRLVSRRVGGGFGVVAEAVGHLRLHLERRKDLGELLPQFCFRSGIIPNQILFKEVRSIERKCLVHIFQVSVSESGSSFQLIREKRLVMEFVEVQHPFLCWKWLGEQNLGLRFP